MDMTMHESQLLNFQFCILLEKNLQFLNLMELTIKVFLEKKRIVL